MLIVALLAAEIVSSAVDAQDIRAAVVASSGSDLSHIAMVVHITSPELSVSGKAVKGQSPRNLETGKGAGNVTFFTAIFRKMHLLKGHCVAAAAVNSSLVVGRGTQAIMEYDQCLCFDGEMHGVCPACLQAVQEKGCIANTTAVVAGAVVDSSRTLSQENESAFGGSRFRSFRGSLELPRGSKPILPARRSLAKDPVFIVDAPDLLEVPSESDLTLPSPRPAVVLPQSRSLFLDLCNTPTPSSPAGSVRNLFAAGTSCTTLTESSPSHSMGPLTLQASGLTQTLAGEASADDSGLRTVVLDDRVGLVNYKSLSSNARMLSTEIVPAPEHVEAARAANVVSLESYFQNPRGPCEISEQVPSSLSELTNMYGRKAVPFEVESVVADAGNDPQLEVERMRDNAVSHAFTFGREGSSSTFRRRSLELDILQKVPTPGLYMSHSQPLPMQSMAGSRSCFAATSPPATPLTNSPSYSFRHAFSKIVNLLGGHSHSPPARNRRSSARRASTGDPSHKTHRSQSMPHLGPPGVPYSLLSTLRASADSGRSSPQTHKPISSLCPAYSCPLDAALLTTALKGGADGPASVQLLAPVTPMIYERQSAPMPDRRTLEEDLGGFWRRSMETGTLPTMDSRRWRTEQGIPDASAALDTQVAASYINNTMSLSEPVPGVGDAANKDLEAFFKASLALATDPLCGLGPSVLMLPDGPELLTQANPLLSQP